MRTTRSRAAVAVWVAWAMGCGGMEPPSFDGESPTLETEAQALGNSFCQATDLTFVAGLNADLASAIDAQAQNAWGPEVPGVISAGPPHPTWESFVGSQRFGFTHVSFAEHDEHGKTSQLSTLIGLVTGPEARLLFDAMTRAHETQFTQHSVARISNGRRVVCIEETRSSYVECTLTGLTGAMFRPHNNGIPVCPQPLGVTP